MPRYVVTGALGAGKTSLIAALGTQMMTVGEPARELIAEHRAATGEQTLDERPRVFLERLIDRSIEKYTSVPTDHLAVFDRGLVDCVAYAAAFGLDTSDVSSLSSLYRYAEPVFLAAPWPEIYRTDDMRQATFAQAVAFHEYVLSAYQQQGYEAVQLPKAPIEERVDFVLSYIE